MEKMEELLLEAAQQDPLSVSLDLEQMSELSHPPVGPVVSTPPRQAINMAKDSPNMSPVVRENIKELEERGWEIMSIQDIGEQPEEMDSLIEMSGNPIIGDPGMSEMTGEALMRRIGEVEEITSMIREQRGESITLSDLEGMLTESIGLGEEGEEMMTQAIEEMNGMPIRNFSWISRVGESPSYPGIIKSAQALRKQMKKRPW